MFFFFLLCVTWLRITGVTSSVELHFGVIIVNKLPFNIWFEVWTLPIVVVRTKVVPVQYFPQSAADCTDTRAFGFLVMRIMQFDADLRSLQNKLLNGHRHAPPQKATV